MQGVSQDNFIQCTVRLHPASLDKKDGFGRKIVMEQGVPGYVHVHSPGKFVPEDLLSVAVRASSRRRNDVMDGSVLIPSKVPVVLRLQGVFPPLGKELYTNLIQYLKTFNPFFSLFSLFLLHSIRNGGRFRARPSLSLFF